MIWPESHPQKAAEIFVHNHKIRFHIGWWGKDNMTFHIQFIETFWVLSCLKNYSETWNLRDHNVSIYNYRRFVSHIEKHFGKFTLLLKEWTYKFPFRISPFRCAIQTEKHFDLYFNFLLLLKNRVRFMTNFFL